MKISRKLKIGVLLPNPRYLLPLTLLLLVAMKTPELQERVEKTPTNMCTKALLEGREKGEWEGGIRYEWNALRPHFSDHLLHLLSPPTHLFRFSLAFCSTSVIPFSFLMSLSFSFFLPFVLLNSAGTYILHGLYLHTAKSFAWFHGGSSIPEPKFKGGAVRAVCSTRHESIIFYVRCAAQARPIPFVLLLELPPEPSGIFAGLSSFRFRFMLFFCTLFRLILLYLIYARIP